MLGLMIVCWAYLLFTILGRVVNYDKISREARWIRIIDNVVIFCMIGVLFFLYTNK